MYYLQLSFNSSVLLHFHMCILLPQLSLQLFDARHELHKTTCNYALELNSLHSKTTPDFLNRIVS